MATTDETLALLKAAQSEAPINKSIQQSWHQEATTDASPYTGTGLTYYDLEAPAKKLYPVITPLRNTIARVKGAGGTATNWKAITKINVSKFQMGVVEGRRGAVIDTEVKDYTAAYKGIGLEDAMTFEGQYSTEGFDDLRARATEGLLRSVMIGEEQIMLGGNGSKDLAQPTNIQTSTASSTGATLNATYKVQVIPLTQDGYYRSSVAGGIAQAQTHTAQDGQAYTAVGGGGSGVIAASEGSQAVTTGNALIADCDVVEGAVAYAWYWGTGTATSGWKLGAITTVNRVVATAPATGEAISTLVGAGATDHSKNPLVYDGILTQIWDSNGASYRKALDGTSGLSINNGAIDELDEALKSFWDNYKLSPDCIWVSAQELKNISNKLINVTSANLMFNTSATGTDREFVAGGMVASYINKFSMSGIQAIPIRLHPNLAPGTILFTSSSLPYPTSNIGNILQFKYRRDYYQIEWPLRTRQYEFGVYADGVLQNYAPFAFGIITNIADA